MQADEFWQYSIRRYAAPGIKDACLLLQDRFGVNVNLLLLCDYLSAQGVGLASDGMQQLVDALAPSEARLRTMRNHRRCLKDSAPDDYKKALEEELSLEKEQQRDLIKALQACVTTSSACHPVWVYMGVLALNGPDISQALAPFTTAPGKPDILSTDVT